MKLAYRQLGIPSQIWAVLQILGDDFTFYDLGFDEAQEKKLNDTMDMHTFPFYNRPGRAAGFVWKFKKYNDLQALFFTITQHGSCDDICICDWTAEDDYTTPLPLTNRERPEDIRMAEFGFADINGVVDYVRQLVAGYFDGNYPKDPVINKPYIAERQTYIHPKKGVTV